MKSQRPSSTSEIMRRYSFVYWVVGYSTSQKIKIKQQMFAYCWKYQKLVIKIEKVITWCDWFREWPHDFHAVVLNVEIYCVSWHRIHKWIDKAVALCVCVNFCRFFCFNDVVPHVQYMRNIFPRKHISSITLYRVSDFGNFLSSRNNIFFLDKSVFSLCSWLFALRVCIV